jgi:hypothetical protein
MVDNTIGSRLAFADGADLAGLGEPLEEPLQRFPARTTGPSDLDSFQDNAPASGR